MHRTSPLLPTDSHIAMSWRGRKARCLVLGQLILTHLHQGLDLIAAHDLHAGEHEIKRHGVTLGPSQHSPRRSNDAVIQESYLFLLSRIPLKVNQQLLGTGSSQATAVGYRVKSSNNCWYRIKSSGGCWVPGQVKG